MTKTLILALALLPLTACTPEAPPKLEVDVRGNGTVKSNPPGINCPGTCSMQLEKGTPVALSAKGPEGSSISFEVPDQPASTDPQRVIALEKDTRVTVTITPPAPPPPAPASPGPADAGSAGDQQSPPIVPPTPVPPAPVPPG